MAVEPTHDRLPCGTDKAELIEHLEAGTRTEHELHCPHCRAVERDHGVLAAAREELAAEEVSAPPRLLGDVMRAVRAEPRSRRTLAVPPHEDGLTRVRETAAARILRLAAEQVSGLSVGRCVIGEETEEGVPVRLTARIEAGAPIPETAEAARRAVRGAGRSQLGWSITRIDVDIADIA
ncbi:hypothetical protein HDA32_004499 [Spinactinospora alkalitolerans]|uniref:Asp23/Gls24 family envelope stress response protein n=1 Tax=Spinactinospora alkalitolerans TaxID=687207 RepID=A0A852TZF6_9ACTN|nr:hypothetical protein [Spinactinospora alkalitolerans]NYE49379.1 hypothetical protein [Spinactinospora alkalitolerans]